MHTDLMLKDVVRCAAILLDAAEAASALAGGDALESVETSFGTAEVVMDDKGIDLDFRNREATVHIRTNGHTKSGERNPGVR